MPKATTPTASRGARRHNPLEDDITATGILRNKPTKRKSKDGEEDEETFVDSRASKNILRIGRELAEEDNAERASALPPPTVDTFGYDSRFGGFEEDEAQIYNDDDEAWGDDDEVVEEVEVDPSDLEMYRKFMPDEDEDDLLKHGWDRQPSGEQYEEPTNLADLILEKIAAHEAGQARGNAAAPPDDYEIPPKVVEVYTKYAHPSALPKLFSFANRTQDWRDSLPLQVWPAAKALQDPAYHPALGRYS